MTKELLSDYEYRVKYMFENWKVMNMKEIAVELTLNYNTVNKFAGMIRNRSEERYGKEGRFNVLPRKKPVHGDGMVAKAVENFLDLFDAGKAGEMKEVV